MIRAVLLPGVALMLLSGCAERLELAGRELTRNTVILTRLDRAVLLTRIDRLEWQLAHNRNAVDRVLIRDQLYHAYAELRELE